MKSVHPFAYACQHCNRVLCWHCETPVSEDVGVKTIGSRYCEAPECLTAEAEAHGLPPEVMAQHRRKSEPRCGGPAN